MSLQRNRINKKIIPIKQKSQSLTFDKISLSFDGSFGADNLYFIVWKKSTDIISAIEAHDVG